MNIHYNAFISYRHHPDDIRVASEIHRALERFQVPKSIRKKYGKITRLFRDKEELPITSDLNDDIDEALKNSDYLIVICSVHTKESIWVQREIELFLKTHHRSKVLTVLASGEPYDVIPEILLHEDVVDPVTGQTKRIDIEPLSCDWRGNHRKAKRDELPRLAAPLLGCAYDELRQRQRQYRARRNMAIISSALVASLSLAIYFLYTSITIQQANVRIQKANEEIKAANIQIQANLNESLINQSRHLATAAWERLEGGDRLTAISLAAAALPSETNVRPYVPEAEQVLSAALGVYNTAGQMEAVGTVTPGVNILVNDFCVSDSGKMLYLYDQRRIITAWDTETLQKQGEIVLGEQPPSMFTLRNDNLIVHDDTLACYKTDGTLLWKWSDCYEVSYLPEEDRLLLIHRKQDVSYELLYIDTATGEQVGPALNCAVDDPEYHPSNFVAATNQTAGFAFLHYYKSFSDPKRYYALKLGTGELLPVDLAFYPVQSMITDSGTLVCIGEEDGLGLAGTVEGDRVTTPGTRQIFCYDLETGALLWENAITSSTGAAPAGIQAIPGSENLLCVCGNQFLILDAATGVQIAQCGAGSIIVDAIAGEQFATAILQDGYLCKYQYGMNYCYEVKCMESGVSAAHTGEACYSLHWMEDHVTVYRNVEGTPAWKCTPENSFSVSQQKVWGRYLAFQDHNYQYLFDTETKTFLYTLEKGQKNLLGFSSDGQTLWYAEGKEAVTAMDIATGVCKTLEIVLDQGDSAQVNSNLAFFNDCLYYVVGNIEKPQVVSWNLNTQEKNTCTLQVPTEDSVAYWSWEILHAEGQYLWLWRYGKMLLEVDLQTGVSQCLIEETTQRPAIVTAPKENLMAIGNLKSIYLRTPGQDSVSVITLDNTNVGSLCIRDHILFALCDNGFICRYDLSGNLLSKTELQVGSRFGYNLMSSNTDLSMLRWHFTADDKLIVNALGDGNIIDCNSWIVQASISSFLLYDENSNCLVCKPALAIAGYNLYNTSELLELAQESLNGFQLTPEQKNAYGIS